ncbi:hypothetical protein HDU76_002046 [Blyttiomyces sp. JEL0837]|nr:hypothetical protein HDU76_002046 [Blyttiomyces sp. JEL0837]
MVARELGLFDKLVLTNTAVLPTQLQNNVTEGGNPLGKGHVIPDFSNPEKRFKVLVNEALADGLLDAALLIRYETAVRPEEKRWPEWIDGQMGKIKRALVALEEKVATEGTIGVDVGSALDLGSISVLCALGYLDFRFAHFDWRATSPKLAAWYATNATRASYVATAPPK